MQTVTIQISDNIKNHLGQKRDDLEDYMIVEGFLLPEEVQKAVVAKLMQLM